jgi:hypothetical protein
VEGVSREVLSKERGSILGSNSAANPPHARVIIFQRPLKMRDDRMPCCPEINVSGDPGEQRPVIAPQEEAHPLGGDSACLYGFVLTSSSAATNGLRWARSCHRMSAL